MECFVEFQGAYVAQVSESDVLTGLCENDTMTSRVSLSNTTIQMDTCSTDPCMYTVISRASAPL